MTEAQLQEALSRKYIAPRILCLSDGTWAVFTPKFELIDAGLPDELALKILADLNLNVYDSAYEPRVTRPGYPFSRPGRSVGVPATLDDLA